MPTLSLEDTRKTVRLTLPSSTETDPAWVEVYDKVLTNDMITLRETEGQTMQTIVAVKNMIAKWCFLEKDGTPAPIDLEHIGQLEFSDFTFISEQIKAFDKYAAMADSEKKNTSSILAPKETETTPTTPIQ